MAQERRAVLTRLANAQITEIFQELQQESPEEAEKLMDDFLDIVFDEAKKFPEQFPRCEGMKHTSADYRMAHMYMGYRIIFQITREKVVYIMVVHEDELPF